LQRLLFGARAPSSGPPGIDRDPGVARALREGPDAISGEMAPLDKAFGETSHPGGKKSLKAPQGCRRDRSGGRSRSGVRVGRHRGVAAKSLAENRQFLATSAYAALRRVTIEDPPQAVADRSWHAWQPVSSSRKRATHSGSLSAPLAESRCSTRLASKARVWTPRSYWRCRSNASTSAARVLLSTAATSCRIGGVKPVDNLPGTRGACSIRLARHPERCQTVHTMSASSPKAASARGVPLAKRATVT
jgi:hypothetical protein